MAVNGRSTVNRGLALGLVLSLELEVDVDLALVFVDADADADVDGSELLPSCVAENAHASL